MRIDVVGLPASGKSTFAVQISNKLSIPHIHLDEFWFESGGKQGRKTTPNLEEVRIKVREKTIKAVESESWVSDGIYLHVQDILAGKANKIIFLDIPLPVRMWGHFKRVFLEPKRHKHLKLWDEITFFRELVKRNFSSKPKLLEFVQEYNDKVITFRSWKEMDTYLKNLH